MTPPRTSAPPHARARRLAALVALAAALSACAGPRVVRRSRHIEGWVQADPAEVGMDGARLRAAAARLDRERGHGIDSMLVVRRGRLVAEHYWNGQTMASLHDLRSATKSVTSLLVGIARDRGLLDVHEPALPYLARAYPELTARAPVAAGPALTLEHLLTMRSGLACDDRVRRSPGHEDRMYRARDWQRFFLELPRSHAPGERTQYCTGNVIALGRILAEATGEPVDAFADAALFAPLGIQAHAWRRFDRGRQIDTGGHLRLRPRAMAKIGQLVLQRGIWDSHDIVSGAWIDASTALHTRFHDDHQPYGYLWWRSRYQDETRALDLVYASGNGGQYIFIVPELDLVVVFTGRNYDRPAAARPWAILGESIIPAALAPPAD